MSWLIISHECKWPGFVSLLSGAGLFTPLSILRDDKWVDHTKILRDSWILFSPVTSGAKCQVSNVRSESSGDKLQWWNVRRESSGRFSFSSSLTFRPCCFAPNVWPQMCYPDIRPLTSINFHDLFNIWRNRLYKMYINSKWNNPLSIFTIWIVKFQQLFI